MEERKEHYLPTIHNSKVRNAVHLRYPDAISPYRAECEVSQRADELRLKEVQLLLKPHRAGSYLTLLWISIGRRPTLHNACHKDLGPVYPYVPKELIQEDPRSTAEREPRLVLKSTWGLPEKQDPRVARSFTKYDCLTLLP